MLKLSFLILPPTSMAELVGSQLMKILGWITILQLKTVQDNFGFSQILDNLLSYLKLHLKYIL